MSRFDRRISPWYRMQSDLCEVVSNIPPVHEMTVAEAKSRALEHSKAAAEGDLGAQRKQQEMKRLACALEHIKGEVRTQEDVFVLLGLPYMPPHLRNFGP